MLRAFRWSLPLALVFAPGCSPKNKSSPPTQPALDENTALTRDISYYADIKPLMDKRCISCHQAGGIAPFGLTDATSVVRMQRAIVVSTQMKSMPPWMADASCNSYQNDRSLTDAEITLLADWSKQGAKIGNPDEYEAPKITDAGLTRTDREIIPVEAYKPKNQANDYHCFVMDWPETTTKFVTGVGVVPGHPDIVHHVIAYRVPPQQIEAVKAMDDAEEGPGYTCFGGPLGSNASLPQLAQWAPGSLGRDLPAKTGLRIDPGSKIVMQVHYNIDHGAPAPDQTKLLFKLDDTVEKEAYVLPFTNPDWVRNHTMGIPAGKSDVVHSFKAPLTSYASIASSGAVSSSSPLKVYSAGLHMHLLGQKSSLRLERKDGTKACLLDIPRWDFHWQGSYILQESAIINPGDVLSLECHFNNGEGKKDVNWGEGTEDEMCLGFVYVTGV